MITAYGDAETKRRVLENGAEALLTKHIDFGTLRSEIDMRVERAAWPQHKLFAYGCRMSNRDEFSKDTKLAVAPRTPRR